MGHSPSIRLKLLALFVFGSVRHRGNACFFGMRLFSEFFLRHIFSGYWSGTNPHGSRHSTVNKKYIDEYERAPPCPSKNIFSLGIVTNLLTGKRPHGPTRSWGPQEKALGLPKRFPPPVLEPDKSPRVPGPEVPRGHRPHRGIHYPHVRLHGRGWPGLGILIPLSGCALFFLRPIPCGAWGGGLFITLSTGSVKKNRYIYPSSGYLLWVHLGGQFPPTCYLPL